jgi:fumarate reductase subunit D
MKKVLTLGFSIPVILMPFVALAVNDFPQVQVTSKEQIITIIQNITGWFAVIVFILAVVFILYAAFMFITAGGDDEQIKKAKHVLLYGIIGIVVALIAYGGVQLIASFLM